MNRFFRTISVIEWPTISIVIKTNRFRRKACTTNEVLVFSFCIEVFVHRTPAMCIDFQNVEMCLSSEDVTFFYCYIFISLRSSSFHKHTHYLCPYVSFNRIYAIVFSTRKKEKITSKAHIYTFTIYTLIHRAVLLFYIRKSTKYNVRCKMLFWYISCNFACFNRWFFSLHKYIYEHTYFNSVFAVFVGRIPFACAKLLLLTGFKILQLLLSLLCVHALLL